ncbi:hypothetical protein MNBD_GAMMA09-2617 [hydrothermal vent metagenome]|uniref:Low temperature requirement protein A n=1 Tax=hydrothermal vent metagenome TaxID=652676 RepID=A0A3B0XGB2_9ZZZZ
MADNIIKKANWLELLFDLIFVYAVSKATHILAHLHDGHIGIAQYAIFMLVMVPIWWVWTGNTLFVTRFDTEDTGQRLLTLLTMLMVVFWTSFINADFDAYYHGYLLFYVAIRLILVLMYWNAARKNPLAAPIALRLGSGFSVGLGVALLSLFFEPPLRYIVLYLGIGIEIITPLLCRHALRELPVKSHHLPERYGLLTIILLGESVILLATNLSETDWSIVTIITAILGFTLIASLWWLYFELMEKHVLGKNLGAGQRIIYGHLFIYTGLSSIAVFIGYAITLELTVITDYLWLNLFAIGMLITGLLISFGWQRIAHRVHLKLYSILLSSIILLMGIAVFVQR